MAGALREPLHQLHCPRPIAVRVKGVRIRGQRLPAVAVDDAGLAMGRVVAAAGRHAIGQRGGHHLTEGAIAVGRRLAYPAGGLGRAG